MKPIGGLNTDVRPVNVKQGETVNARNIVYDKNESVSNEKGFDLVFTVPQFNGENGNVCGIIETPFGISIHFINYPISGMDEIGVFDGVSYTIIVRDGGGTIVADSFFNFDINTPISGKTRKNYNDDIVVTWRSKDNPAFLLNIDNLPYDVDGNKFILDAINAPDFSFRDKRTLALLFPDQELPQQSLIDVNEFGGVLETGVYFITTRYELDDGTITSWGATSNPIYVNNSTATVDSNHDYDGSEAKEVTGKSISLKLENIDNRYPTIRIGIIKKIGGEVSTFKGAAYRIQGRELEITYTGRDNEEVVDLTEVTVDNVTYDRVQTLDELQNRLHIAGLERTFEFDYQQYANMITSEWVSEDIISLDGIRGSYKDSITSYYLKGFQAEEVYAYYISFLYKDGTYSPAFHIPGRAPSGNDLTLIENLPLSQEARDEFAKVDADAKNYTLRGTASINADNVSGGMSYWENETDFYPDTDDFNSVSLGGEDLRGKNIRHHKFPEIPYLQFQGQRFISDSIESDSNESQFQVLIFQNGDDHRQSYIHNFSIRQSWIYDGNYGIANGLSDKYPSGMEVPTEWGGNTLDSSYKFDIAGKFIVKVRGNLAVSNWGTVNIRYLFYHNSNKLDEVNSISGVDHEPNIDDDTWLGMSVNATYSIDVQVDDIIHFPFWLEGGLPDFEDAKLSIEILKSGIDVNDNIIEGSSFTKPLGIRFDNIKIPDEIKDKVQGYQIFYAKRDLYNSTIISQSLIAKENLSGITNDSDIRYWAFDNLFNKYPLVGNYIKPLLGTKTLEPSDTSDFRLVNEEAQIREIKDLQYLPEDNSATNPSNENNEEVLSFSIENGITDAPNFDTYFLTNLCNYRKDMYKNFTNQDLVSTGKIYYINNQDNDYTTDTIYGGDIYRTVQGVAIPTGVDLYNTIKSIIFPCESKANIGLRHGDREGLRYYPKFDTVENVTDSLNNYLYNTDYTAINDIVGVFPQSFLPSVSAFPYRIARGVVAGIEDTFINWRLFRPLDYFELRKNRGKIVNIETFNKELIIHTEDALFRTISEDRLQAGSIEVNLGTGDIFAREPDEILPNDGGYAGVQSQHSAKITKFGYIFIDEKRGKVFILSDTLKEISAIKRRDFFLENIARNNINYFDDNPYNEDGFTISIDEENNRLILVKNDGDGKSFTSSFDFLHNHWVCFHDYRPRFIFNIENNLYSHGENGVYKHNSDLVKAIYYRNTQPQDIQNNYIPYESFLDVVFADIVNLNKVYSAITWSSEVKDENGAFRHNDTLTKVLLYNSYQASIETILDRHLNLSGNMRKEEGYWSFNDFRDVVSQATRDNNIPFLDADLNLILSSLDNTVSSFRKRRFIDNYLVSRFYFDNLNNRTLYLYDTTAMFRQGKRSS